MLKVLLSYLSFQFLLIYFDPVILSSLFDRGNYITLFKYKQEIALLERVVKSLPYCPESSKVNL